MSERLIVLGAPWSGKNTLSKRLQDEEEYTIIEAGGLIRDYCKINPEINNLVSKGYQIPHEISHELVEQAYHRTSNRRNVAFNGYPRQKLNAEHLQKNIEEGFIGALYLDVSRETILMRHETNNQQRIDRNDHGIEILEKRLEHFYSSETDEVLNYYASMNKLFNIEAEKSPEEVWDIVKAILLLFRTTL